MGLAVARPSASEGGEPADETRDHHGEDGREPPHEHHASGHEGEGSARPVVHAGAREGVDARRHEPDANGGEGALGRSRPRPVAQSRPVPRDDGSDNGGGQEHGRGGEHRAGHAVGAITHEDGDEHGRPGRELGEGVAVEKLARRHPVKTVNHLALQLRDDAEPPADADETQPEERPGESREIEDHEPERGRCSQRDSGTTRTMTRAVLTWSGPTRRKMAAERSSDLRSRMAARIIRPVVTNTSPTTAAPMPRMAEVAWGVKPTWKYSQVRARRIIAPGTRMARAPHAPPRHPASLTPRATPRLEKLGPGRSCEMVRSWMNSWLVSQGRRITIAS